jgi:hypothetical protein
VQPSKIKNKKQSFTQIKLIIRVWVGSGFVNRWVPSGVKGGSGFNPVAFSQ